MIWLWIAVALLISVFMLRGKKISYINYLWVCLPIDMYGLNIAGVTVKPYMLFCLVILLCFLYEKPKSFFTGSIAIPFILLGALIVNLFNGGTKSSIMAILMAVVVYLCAAIYVSNIEDCIKEIPDVIVATSIGYGLVFVIAFLLFSLKLNIPGIIALSRRLPGIIMQFDNMNGSEFIQVNRLRGFNIDPNACVGIFLAAFPICVSKLLLEKRHKTRYLISFGLSLTSIFLTNSRMGIFATFIVILFSGINAYRIATEEQKRKIILSTFALLLLFVIVIISTGLKDRLTETLTSTYGTRADFNDQYGRGSIWSEAINVWTRRGLFFGIGTGNMQYYTSTGRECHNTWLEWLCGCGLLIGSSIIMMFFSLVIRGLGQTQKGTEQDKRLFLSIYMGFTGMVLCLFTVDNITNGYLWFFALTLLKVFSNLQKNTVKKIQMSKYLRY